MTDQDLPKSPMLAHQQGYNEGYDTARKDLRDEIAMRMLPELFREYQAGIRAGEYPAHPDAKENLCADALRWADAMLKTYDGYLIAESVSECNARAIAAAPDMIDTLIESYHTIKAEVDQWGERKEHHPMQPTLTQIEATLRKTGVTEE